MFGSGSVHLRQAGTLRARRGGHQHARSVGELDEEIRTVAEPKEGVLDRSWPEQEAEAKVLDLRPSATLACVGEC